MELLQRDLSSMEDFMAKRGVAQLGKALAFAYVTQYTGATALAVDCIDQLTHCRSEEGEEAAVTLLNKLSADCVAANTVEHTDYSSAAQIDDDDDDVEAAATASDADSDNNSDDIDSDIEYVMLDDVLLPEATSAAAAAAAAADTNTVVPAAAVAEKDVLGERERERTREMTARLRAGLSIKDVYSSLALTSHVALLFALNALSSDAMRCCAGNQQSNPLVVLVSARFRHVPRQTVSDLQSQQQMQQCTMHAHSTAAMCRFTEWCIVSSVAVHSQLVELYVHIDQLVRLPYCTLRVST
eukprot:7719-Heterococcus_DN1.PRE.4